jgi:hypothetical protein
MRPHVLIPVLILLSAGCALWPRFGPPPAVGPPHIQGPADADTTALTRTAADSAADDLNQAMLERLRSGKTLYVGEDRARHPAAPKRPRRTGSSASDSTASLLSDSTASGAKDSVSTPHPAALSVGLPAPDRGPLELQARSDIGWADSTVAIQRSRMLAGRDRDKLETASGLAKQAREALERGDIPAAANLAYKARLLIEEVAKK